MSINQYFSSLQNKKVTVLGVGVSNIPLIKMLCRANVKVVARDKRSRDAMLDTAEELESLGVTLILGKGYLIGLDGDVIFRTPGMRPDLHEIQCAVDKGAVLTSEMELFFEHCPCHTIAVTGSDGKTTTTTIIAKLLEQAGNSVYLGGNIGRPLLPDVSGMEPEGYAILELSSFQLMTMKRSPDIAVVTNVTPNHLDVHLDMAEYIAAKENCFIHQNKKHRVVLNYDNEITRGFAQFAKGEKVFFSRKERIEHGVFLQDDMIYVHGKPYLSIKDISLPGDHNVENYMAAIGAIHHLVSKELVQAFAKKFTGVEHRIELIRVKDGIFFYNDSIASSPARTIAGLRSFSRRVILIAGGYDKKIPFDDLGVEIAQCVKSLFLSGHTAEKIKAAVVEAVNYSEKDIDIYQYQTFNEAVRQAAAAAKPEDVVLLSPACASFDQFKNFAERGEAFKRLIYEL